MHAIAAMLRIPHVLVVDHSVEDRQLFQHVLIRHGCRVTVADDGFEALASAEEDPPHLVVTDLVLPEMSGFELCEELHASPRTEHVPIILATSLVEDSVGVSRLIDDFGATMLAKPVSPAALSTRVETVLRNSATLGCLSQGARLRARVLQRRSASLCEQSAARRDAAGCHPPAHWHELLDRVIQDFTDMPELTLTVPQAGRRWQVSATLAALTCECLRRRKFLVRGEGGRFARVE
jgi:twitching motility two-component system response regulator PilH